MGKDDLELEEIEREYDTIVARNTYLRCKSYLKQELRLELEEGIKRAQNLEELLSYGRAKQRGQTVEDLWVYKPTLRAPEFRCEAETLTGTKCMRGVGKKGQHCYEHNK